MDEEVFNLTIRKFLKRFGVTAQREIEKAVTEAIRSGAITGTEHLPVHATLAIPGLLEAHRIEGTIALAGEPPADES